MTYYPAFSQLVLRRLLEPKQDAEAAVGELLEVVAFECALCVVRKLVFAGARQPKPHRTGRLGPSKLGKPLVQRIERREQSAQRVQPIAVAQQPVFQPRHHQHASIVVVRADLLTSPSLDMAAAALVTSRSRCCGGNTRCPVC